MKALFSCLAFLSLYSIAAAQTNPLNQTDSLGSKHGVWIEYLDSYFKVLKDSTGAAYWAYNYYDHGTNTNQINFGKEWKKHFRLEQYPVDTLPKTGIQPLNGDYKWYDKKGKVISEDSFRDGTHLSSKIYDDGILVISYDYTKNYMEIPWTYLIVVHEDDDVTVQYYWRKGPEGWQAYPIAQ